MISKHKKHIKKYVNKFKYLRDKLNKKNDVEKVCDMINDLFYKAHKNNLIDEVIKEINKYE